MSLLIYKFLKNNFYCLKNIKLKELIGVNQKWQLNNIQKTLHFKV